MFYKVGALPFTNDCYFFCFVVDEVARTFFRFAIGEEKCSENWKITKRGDVNEEIIVFFLKIEASLPHLVGANIPNEVIIYDSIFVFQS